MNIKIKKLHPDAVLPTYATDGSGCFDIYALNEPQELRYSFTYSTGLAFEIPAGHVMLVYSRSGHGFKQGIRLANSVGVIDSDYRGELMVKMQSDSVCLVGFRKGERIAQAMIVPVQQVQFEEVEELSSTDRGEGGLGSTGK